MLASVGFSCTGQLKREHIFRRVSASAISTYEDIYPSVEKGAFLRGEAPSRYQRYLEDVSASSFVVNEDRTCAF